MRNFKSAAIRKGLALLALAGFWVVPAGAAEFSSAQTQEIQGIIKSYLIGHPEVLRDVQSELDRREKEAAAQEREKSVTDNASVIFNSPYQAVYGNANGKISLVEFFDYNCPYCKVTMGDMDKLHAQFPDLRIVLKDFPVLGPGSVEAAKVARAVAVQLSGDKYWKFHELLLGEKRHIGKAEALAAAQNSGVDMTKLAADMAAKPVEEGISQVMQVADKLNLTGTPSFVIGNDVVVGAVGFDTLKLKVESMEKCGKTTCS
ncbi:MAG: DsbA family protein [Hyphomicrobiales bacterium]|nr:DsbA family protein [Hyphomicrobiales bacterium]MDE2113927.1 thioredoxin domain-containing protein [Hyphomicrobiales bacterium]